jgi:formylglycine-generating enzyme required for sulfatase activity
LLAASASGQDVTMRIGDLYHITEIPSIMAIQIWQPGDKIKDDRFHILKQLGKGGFDITYLAQDTLKHRQIVIKTMNADQQLATSFATVQEKFVREGFLLKGFSHDHLVEVHEQIRVGSLWGLVMEYISGQDLHKYVEVHGALNEPEALGYIDQVTLPLDYIHRKNFFHQNIKPQNIMLRPKQKEVVLIDFGIAREFVDLEAMDLSDASRIQLYKPVEHYKKQSQFGACTDIYALAATLYFLLTGALPGGGGIDSSSYSSIARQTNYQRGMGEECDQKLWQQLSQRGVSERTLAAIQAGMQVEPEHRPQTMMEFRQLLGLVQTRRKKKQKEFTFEVGTLEVRDHRLGEKVNVVKTSKESQYLDFNLGSGAKLEMVRIPAGIFMMGQTSEEQQELIAKLGEDNYQEYCGGELPQHLVNVPEFYLGKYPVTQRQYLAIMDENPSCWIDGGLPIENVSWRDAQKFCKKLSAKLGKNFGLPSEAQWEYACRAGTKTPFHFGETIDRRVANHRTEDWDYDRRTYPEYYDDGEFSDFEQKTTCVGYYRLANNFGLYDMHGNICEWCEDRWHENYHGAPVDGSAWVSATGNSDRLLRGGSLSDYPIGCRSAYRFRLPADGRYSNVGFRVLF